MRESSNRKVLNQKGALDLPMMLALFVVVAVGFFMVSRIAGSGDDAAEIETSKNEVQAQEEKDTEKDELEEKKQEEEPKEEVSVPVTGSLSLGASAIDNGVAVSWTNSGVPADDGYKLVYSSNNPAPEYGVHSSQYISPGETSSAVNLSDGQTYTFRLCAYRAESGTCDNYSVAAKATAPKYQEETVKAGATTLALDGTKVNWTFTGTAPHGFKLVMNTVGSPRYPDHSVQYIQPDARSTKLPEEAAGTYFVRLCKYTADANIKGGCTDYSNQIEYVIE